MPVSPCRRCRGGDRHQVSGHLAAALTEGFCRAEAVPISIHNRAPEHALALASVSQGLRAAEREEFDAEQRLLLPVVAGPAILRMRRDRIARLRHRR